jgi:hypothetical protein
MKTIQIDKNEARRLYKDATPDLKGKLEAAFSKKELTESAKDRIETILDAVAELKLDPGKALPYRKPTTDLEKATNAFVKLNIIAEALREGWRPDWKNGNQKKWFPHFEHGSSGFGFSHSYYHYDYARTAVGSRLCFPTEELAAYFGTQFIDIHNEILLYNQK